MIFLLIQSLVYSQDTIQNSYQDSTIIDTISLNASLKPIVLKKYNRIYFCFDKKQSEYLYNSMIQRDLFKKIYFEKSTDFDNIVIAYDNTIFYLNTELLLKDSIIIKQDSIIINKELEFNDKEEIYKDTIKKEKRKKIIATTITIVTIIVSFLLLI